MEVSGAASLVCVGAVRGQWGNRSVEWTGKERGKEVGGVVVCERASPPGRHSPWGLGLAK